MGGVPDTSHFARVIVAADYRMKRISMGLEPAPVAGLAELHGPDASNRRHGPAEHAAAVVARTRLWAAGPRRRRPHLATGQGSVKTLTEDDYLDASGQKQSGQERRCRSGGPI